MPILTAKTIEMIKKETGKSMKELADMPFKDYRPPFAENKEYQKRRRRLIRRVMNFGPPTKFEKWFSKWWPMLFGGVLTCFWMMLLYIFWPTLFLYK